MITLIWCPWKKWLWWFHTVCKTGAALKRKLAWNSICLFTFIFWDGQLNMKQWEAVLIILHRCRSKTNCCNVFYAICYFIWCCSWRTKSHYCPPKKWSEGNVFTGVCPSTGSGYSPHPPSPAGKLTWDTTG